MLGVPGPRTPLSLLNECKLLPGCHSHHQSITNTPPSSFGPTVFTVTGEIEFDMAFVSGGGGGRCQLWIGGGWRGGGRGLGEREAQLPCVIVGIGMEARCEGWVR